MDQQDIPTNKTRGKCMNGEESGPGELNMRGDILKDLIRVVNDVLPALDQMKSSIQESSHKIPKASSQLSSVTQATESATVEILNVLDSMTQRFEGFETLLAQLEDRKIKLQTWGGEIVRDLDSLSSRYPGDDGFAKVQRLCCEYFEAASNPGLVGQARKSLSEAQGEAMSIAMALQVQDITTQQILGVISLIESVRAQLTQVLENLENDGDFRVQQGRDTDSLNSHNEAFNSDARYSRDPQRQDMADDIINEWSNSSGQKSDQ